MERTRAFSAKTPLEIMAMLSKTVLEEYLEGGYLLKTATVTKNEDNGRYNVTLILTLDY